MVFWHKSPITRVGRIMTVVAHHPIVIELKGIAISKLTININMTILNVKAIAFVYLDRTLVDSDVAHREMNSLALLRNPDRTIIVASPTSYGILRI